MSITNFVYMDFTNKKENKSGWYEKKIIFLKALRVL